MDIAHKVRPQRVQMDIADQVLEIAVLLAQDRFVAILKKLPVPSIFPVKPGRVPGEQAAHEYGNRDDAAS